jgi:RNA polymerase sigma-70 factor (ECF subfamily)
MRRQIVERAIAGDHDAFAELARASLDRQYAVATLILRDVERARDAVQEALISAWRDVRSLRDPDAWDAWLHRLTVRACYRLAKKERRRDLAELHVEPEATPDRSADFAHLLGERDRMEREMDGLSVEQRSVLVLHFYADLTLEQAADVLDIPVGTVKSRLHSGLRALRGSLVDEPTGPSVRVQERTA